MSTTQLPDHSRQLQYAADRVSEVLGIYVTISKQRGEVMNASIEKLKGMIGAANPEETLQLQGEILELMKRVGRMNTIGEYLGKAGVMMMEDLISDAAAAQAEKDADDLAA